MSLKIKGKSAPGFEAGIIHKHISSGALIYMSVLTASMYALLFGWKGMAAVVGFFSRIVT